MIHLIFLAAGYSARFGANKLLYDWKGKPMYRHVLDRLLEISAEGSGFYDVTVVTQYREILEDLRNEPVTAAVNEDPSRGISSSVQTGIRSLAGQGVLRSGDYMMFLNGDQPGLRKETIRLLAEGTAQSGKPYGALVCSGEMISPCLFHTSSLPALMSLRGDRGGKKILKQHTEEVFLFPTEFVEEVEDIDRL